MDIREKISQFITHSGISERRLDRLAKLPRGRINTILHKETVRVSLEECHRIEDAIERSGWNPPTKSSDGQKKSPASSTRLLQALAQYLSELDPGEHQQEVVRFMRNVLEKHAHDRAD